MSAAALPPPLPEGRWLTDAGLVARWQTDRSGWRPDGRPLAVALARSVGDVQAVLRAAYNRGVAVVPRGAGTGLSGGAAGTDGAIVLDVTGMNAIREIAPHDGVAVVEPGVVTADLDRAAAAYGLRYAPDPASFEMSTIGGNIATNAGGLRCAKYGVTRDSVLGLDVVLADGELISTGGRTLKGVTGFDLTSLIVGSEGTLGVIVGATLRLRPCPRSTATLAARFASAEAAAAGVSEVLASGVTPAMAELLDAATLTTLGDPGGGAYLLIQTDGADAGPDADLVEKALAPLATTVYRAHDDAEAERLIARRRNALPAIERLGRPLIEDIVVPRSRMAEAITSIAAIAAETGVHVFTLAHAADGNLHPIITVDRETDGIPDHAWHAAEQIFELAIALGGRLTGEHGVGVLKRRWAPTELGHRAHQLQQRIREVFDPKQILNPGKAL